MTAFSFQLSPNVWLPTVMKPFFKVAFIVDETWHIVNVSKKVTRELETSSSDIREMTLLYQPFDSVMFTHSLNLDKPIKWVITPGLRPRFHAREWWIAPSGLGASSRPSRRSFGTSGICWQVKVKWKIDRDAGAESTVLPAMYWDPVARTQLSEKEMVSIYWSPSVQKWSMSNMHLVFFCKGECARASRRSSE